MNAQKHDPFSLNVGYAGLVIALVALFVSKFWTAALAFIGWHYFPEAVLFGVITILGMTALALGGTTGWILAVGSWGGFVVLSAFAEPFNRYLILAALLFSIGMYGMVVSRNAVRVLMSIELMLNAVNINMVTFARYVDPSLVRGQVFAIFILTVAAAEAAVGLAIVLSIYRNMSTVDMERFNVLRW